MLLLLPVLYYTLVYIFPFNFWPHQCPRDSRESGTRELILLRTNATTQNTYVSV